ncbi:hypothetical protein AEYBE204_11430 [Asticcacaulis sp. YBE204]|nr:hypothetical protein AEYBE204_11430 [Asticcacaulis sp. YBE204]
MLKGCVAALVLSSTGLSSVQLASAQEREVSVAVGDILRDGLEAQARGDGEALLKAALALARSGARPDTGDADLVRVWIRDAQTMGAKLPKTFYASRGLLLGPAYKSGKIAANGKFTTRQSFAGGQMADILVVPAPGAALSLRVIDDEGDEVCAVTASSENLGCRWVPVYTAPSSITVVNTSRKPAKFYLVMN